MITSTDNAEHYTWGQNCDGWHLLKSDTLSVIQERMPPGTSEQLHYHQQAQQVFYVLSGSAKFIVDGEDNLLNPANLFIWPRELNTIFSTMEIKICTSSSSRSPKRMVTG